MEEEMNHHEEEPAEAKASPDAPCEKCQEYLAGWKRAQADYQNLVKESEREKANFVKYANEKLLSDLLPALDQFELVLKHLPNIDELPEDQKKPWENWLVGVRAVKVNWDQAAKEAGLEPIPTDIAFNPELHEAVAEEEAEGFAPGTIARVVEEGWKLHGKALRPAKVVVAK